MNLKFINASCLVLISSLLLNCQAIKRDSEVTRLDGQQWKLVSIKHRPVNNNGNAYLEFSTKLEVQGKAFCNSIKGEYELMGKDQLTFSDLVSTKMYCEGVMNLENEMITNLQNVKRYSIKNGMLYLHSTDGLLLAFKK